MTVTPPTIAPPSAEPSGPLGYRDFRLLFVTQLATGLRMPLLFVTQAWYVNVAAPESQRLLLLGLLATLRGAAFLGYVLFGGALADRYPRRTMLLIAHLLALAGTVATAVLLMLPGAAEGEGLWLPAMFLAFTAFGLINAQDLPTRNAMLRDVVPEHMVTRAVTIFQLALSLTMLVAGPIAGVAIDSLGFGPTYLIAALSHVVVLAAVWQMHSSDHAADPEASNESMLENVRAGLRLLRDDRVVRWVVLGTWIAFTAGISVMGLLIAAWASDILNLGATGWGIMMLFWGLGGVITSGVLVARGDYGHKGMLFIAAIAIFGAAVVGFGFSRTLVAAFLFNGIAGARLHAGAHAGHRDRATRGTQPPARSRDGTAAAGAGRGAGARPRDRPARTGDRA